MTATKADHRVLGAFLNKYLDEFLTRLKRRHLVGSYNCASETAKLLRHLVGSTRWTNAAVLIRIVRVVGRMIIEAQPRELAIGNIVRRVLYIIREEYHNYGRDVVGMQLRESSTMTPASDSSIADDSFSNSSQPPLNSEVISLQPTLFSLLDERYGPESHDFTRSLNIKGVIIEGINELIEDISGMYSQIEDQAIEHIHANEVILTFGQSKTVMAFLLAAAEKRKFEVIVAESAPSFYGHDFAKDLALAGIETTVIPDSAVFAIMARVNKVITGVHSVLANGGCIAHVGAHMIALAAKHYSVPFVVCTGMYKLSPLYPYDLDQFNSLEAPTSVVPYDEFERIRYNPVPPIQALNFERSITTDMNIDWKNSFGGTLLFSPTRTLSQNPNSLRFSSKPDDNVHILCPAFDYIPPDLIALFITNMGGHSPSYIYRLVAEYYHLGDYSLAEDEETVNDAIMT